MTKTNIAIIGASGGIGSAFVRLLSQNENNTIYAFARSANATTNSPLAGNATEPSLIPIDYNDAESIRIAAELALQQGPFDLGLVETGFFHYHPFMT